jgi:hypothetical protein
MKNGVPQIFREHHYLYKILRYAKDVTCFSSDVQDGEGQEPPSQD